ncbi:thioredoxin [Echinicola rosea]|uniref:Thioredoxin n=2 Tax=Echinicola rosea TaxID=1807691 RepID=A0ABQ1VDJ2_9BACT|nr:thioredoxin [Echinicola rosea]
MAQEEQAIKWYTFEEATALNKENPKMVIVDVYTDWCGWCKKMDKETFTDAEVISYLNDHFYAVKLDAENNGKKFEFKGEEYTEASMARAMRVSSYPNFVIIDSTMENITQLPGYRKPEAFIKDLKTTIQRFGKD